MAIPFDAAVSALPCPSTPLILASPPMNSLFPSQHHDEAQLQLLALEATHCSHSPQEPPLIFENKEERLKVSLPSSVWCPDGANSQNDEKSRLGPWHDFPILQIKTERFVEDFEQKHREVNADEETAGEEPHQNVPAKGGIVADKNPRARKRPRTKREPEETASESLISLETQATDAEEPIGIRQRTKASSIKASCSAVDKILDQLRLYLHEMIEVGAHYPKLPESRLRAHLPPSFLRIPTEAMEKCQDPMLPHRFFDSLQLMLLDGVGKAFADATKVVNQAHRAYRHRRVNSRRNHIAQDIRVSDVSEDTPYEAFRKGPYGRKAIGGHLFPVTKLHFGTSVANAQQTAGVQGWMKQLERMSLQAQRQESQEPSIGFERLSSRELHWSGQRPNVTPMKSESTGRGPLLSADIVGTISADAPVLLPPIAAVGASAATMSALSAPSLPPAPSQPLCPALFFSSPTNGT